MTPINEEPVDAAHLERLRQRMGGRHAAVPRPDDSPTDGRPAPHSQPYSAQRTVFVASGQFSIDGIAPDEVEAVTVRAWANGAFYGLSQTGARFRTGIATGPILVEVQALTQQPEPVEPRWEWVVEVPIASRSGQVRINGFELSGDPFSNLATAGAGDYRARVSATGRSLALDLTVDDVIETYLVQVWPALPAPAETIRRPPPR